MEFRQGGSPGGGGGDGKPREKFSVYQNTSLTRALASRSVRPSLSVLLLLALSPIASASSLMALSSREGQLFKVAGAAGLSMTAVVFAVRLVEAALGLVALLTLPAFFRALVLYNGGKALAKEDKVVLSKRQLGLLGLKTTGSEGSPMGEQTKKPPKAKPSTPSEPIVPIRRSSFSYTPSRVQPRIGSSHLSPGSERLTTLQMSPSTPLQKPVSSPSTPWSRKSSGSAKGIQTEAMLDQFLATLDENIDNVTDSANKTATPPATITSFGIASPVSVTTSTTPSGATRSTPLRPVRMSPGSHQKYSTPPKKGEGELPPPMSLEQTVDAFENLGVYPEIEQWRNNLRQWFSSVLMSPLVEKIKSSHIQVKQTTTSIGASVNVSQVGSDLPSTTPPVSLSPLGGTKDWQPTVTVDEDGILNQMRAALLQSRNAPVAQTFGSPQQPQSNPLLPAIQACIDAITEHQRLNALMKGELIKGLLPQSSVRADYTVHRVQELAEGTCLKNYDYMGYRDGYGKSEKKWTSELPTDSHLLLYLFAAFLEHPKWMLHVDPTSYSGAQSSKNPLFLGILPPKERFPEKYVALISGVPAIIHPGALVLAVGKQSPPVFALYWDKKLQFSLQGRTALWDAILLLCHQIKVGYGGIVRGTHIGSSALNILSVLDSDMES
ncbi:transmembrane protein 209 [Triticum urartu]|uniref:Transmembrane protein 209 n=1 Tax=Triticum urartu TaxID=4572 RepID=A0A8R7Q5P3_TRIUA|nr:transmembrane protein 209 [Triticum urartu]